MTGYKIICLREETEDILIRSWYVTLTSLDGKTYLNTYISHFDVHDKRDFGVNFQEGDEIAAEHCIEVHEHKKVDPSTELTVNQLRNQDLFSFGEIKAVVEIRKIYNKRFAYALSSISSDEVLLEFCVPIDFEAGDKILVNGAILLYKIQKLEHRHHFTINSIDTDYCESFIKLSSLDRDIHLNAYFMTDNWAEDSNHRLGRKLNAGDIITFDLSIVYVIDNTNHKLVDKDTELSFIPHSWQTSVQTVVDVCQIIDEFELYALCLIASDTLVKVRVSFERAVNYKVGDRIWVNGCPELYNVEIVKKRIHNDF